MSGDNREAQGRRQARALEREQRILGIRAAAVRVFAQRGYKAATMEQVAAGARLGKATLYHYFATKQQLFADILDRENQTLLSISEDELALGQDPLQTTRGICQRWIEHFAEQPDLARLMLPLMSAGADKLERELGAELRRRVEAAHAPLRGVLQRLAAEGDASIPWSSIISTFVLGLVAKAAAGQGEQACRANPIFFDLLQAARAASLTR